jgi:hypothetical protein
MGYLDETLFEKQYGSITNLIRLLEPNYMYSTFENIDIIPILKEYNMILDFPNDNHKVYFK